MNQHSRRTARDGRLSALAGTLTAMIALAALCMRSDAEAATAPLAVDPVPQINTLDEFDTLLLARDRMAWTVRDAANNPAATIYGKPLAQYADQYVFNAAAEARLKDLRTRAATQSAAGAKSGLAGTLQQARAALEFETYRLAVLYAQETMSSALPEHEKALQAFMDKSPPAEQQQTRARIDPLREQARRSVDELMQIPTLAGLQQATTQDAWFALPKAYNEERMRLAPYAAAWDKEHGIAPLSRTRSKPCAPPYSPPSTTDKPQVDPAYASQPEYPPAARRSGFEGKIHVRAEISAKGCPERVEIARSSGVESLDAAALKWAEGLRFMPAQVAGNAQPASYTFAVSFRLDD